MVVTKCEGGASPTSAIAALAGEIHKCPNLQTALTRRVTEIAARDAAVAV